MTTQAGQATSGATGAANEQAQLLASRTGNTAALPGIIDATARSGMKQQSNNALDVGIANAKEKLQQQQQGAQGLTSLYGTGTEAALKSLGLADEDINSWVGADKETSQALQAPFQDISDLAGAYSNVEKGINAQKGGG